jgi:predicted MPP superfamily phosphohydrolase
MALLVTAMAAFGNFLFFLLLMEVKSRKIYAAVFFCLTILAFGGATLAWNKLLPFAELLSRASFSWFIAQLFLFPLLLVVLLVVAAYPNMPSSMLRVLSVLALLAAFSLSAYGSFYESTAVEVVRRELTPPRLPPKAAGLKIAHLTDLHLGIFFTLEDLAKTLDMTKAERPDVVFVTGDLIDDVAQVGPMLQLIDDFAADIPYGVYYVWGNHEYLRDYSLLERNFARSKMKVLKNSSDWLIPGQEPIYISGVGYALARDPEGNYKEYEEMLSAALRPVPEDAFKILLAHHSIVLDNAFAHGIDLTFAGHTHGTQVGLFGQPIYKQAFKYIRGLYADKGKYGYVSTGVSGWFPFRLGCPPEVAVFVLRGQLANQELKVWQKR